jgi:hypothetical protein
MDGLKRVGTGAGAALAFLALTGSALAQETRPLPVSDDRSKAVLTGQVEATPTDESAEAAEKDKAAPKDKAATAASEECSGGLDWKKVPPIHLFPRPGYFGIPPKGPGYYSLVDQLRGECRKDRPPYGYLPFALQPPPFFDTDWRYLENPKTPPQDFLEALHRIHHGDHWLFATGGEARWRHMHAVNSRLAGPTNDYDLIRTRVFGDLWYEDRFRAYIEFLDAHSFNQDLAPALPDVDRSDFLNAFFELKVFDGENGKGYLRAGRQELLFGSQRLISPPDWNNTRRTFNGVRGYYVGKKWDVDLFWAQPVIPDPSNLDSVDNNQNFAGLWVTHRPDKGQFRDFYYLFLDNTNRQTQQGIVRAPVNVHTLGTRWVGDKNHWLYDVEAMLQLGEQGRQDLFAGAFTSGLGYHFENRPMNPVAWLYYDFASGDQSPNRGHFNTFNQHFAFGHYYFGWLDLVGRQNIHDINAHLYLYPTKWLTLNLQYHHFELASSRDALYNATGAAIRRDPTGQAGHHVGDELDIIANLHLSRRSDILVGYSHLWAGNFIEQTGPGRDPSLFYFMYNFRW